MRRIMPILLVAAVALAGCQVKAPAPDYDVIIRHGSVYDGSGGQPLLTDIGVRGQRIAAIGDLTKAQRRARSRRHGMAVAPGLRQHAVVGAGLAVHRRTLAVGHSSRA